MTLLSDLSRLDQLPEGAEFSRYCKIRFFIDTVLSRSGLSYSADAGAAELLELLREHNLVACPPEDGR